MTLDEQIEKAEAALGATLPASAPTDGLEIVLDGYAGGPRTALADLVFEAAVERALKNLITTEHLASERSTLDVSPQVIAIVGLPRTGSTLLHNVLSLADGVTAVSHLDAINPTWRTGAITQDEARADVDARLELMDVMSSGIRDRHPVQADWPDECTLLLASSGGSHQWPIMFELPGHLAWLADADVGEHYDAYRRALGVVTDGSAGLLVLKSPFHVLRLDELRRVIPGVRVVATVRASTAVVPSWFGLLEATQAPLYGTSRLEDGYVRQWTATLDRMATCLVEADEAGLIDGVIRYEDLVADPVGTAQRLLDDVGMTDPGAHGPRPAEGLGQPEPARPGVHAAWTAPDVSDVAGLRAHDRCFGLVEGGGR